MENQRSCVPQPLYASRALPRLKRFQRRPPFRSSVTSLPDIGIGMARGFDAVIPPSNHRTTRGDF